MDYSEKDIYFDSNKDHLNDEGVSLYVDAFLFDKQEKLPESILQHVEDCKQCKMSILEVYDLNKENKTISFKEHPFFNRKQKVRPLYSTIKIIAAASVLLFIVLFSLNKINNNKNKSLVKGIEAIKGKHLPGSKIFFPHDSLKNNTPDSGETPPEINEEKQYSQNFKESPVLESFIETGLRSEDLEIISPKNNKSFKFKEKLRFKWETESLKIITIEIWHFKDNIDKKILERTSENNKLIINNKLVPGLYYWKLISDDELIYVGKFFVGQ
jgi:hypothetical protein